MSISVSHSRGFAISAAFAFFLLAALPCAAAAQALYHVVEKGETLYSVALAYGVKPEALASANSIDDPSRLKAGKKLLIPSVESTHKVEKGETLFSIAKACGVTVDDLRAANKLSPSAVIKAGQSLKIPLSGKAQPDDQSPLPIPATKPSPPPAIPDAVKTSAKPMSKNLSWPCTGEVLKLEGKANGVVIRTQLGESEKAIAAGTVYSAGPYRGYGNIVIVLTRGYFYVYGGNESISVRAGDQVRAGQELGKIGVDAKQGWPAAYFLVFKDGVAVDPALAPRDYPPPAGNFSILVLFRHFHLQLNRF
jgi:murein DD-endopeptidase MepM/ murein hydrolase activator NlpD